MSARTGTIYSEMTNKGRSSVRYVRGCAPVYCFRWVAEIQINGKRHRFRSTSEANCRIWLNDMLAKAGPIAPGAAAHFSRQAIKLHTMLGLPPLPPIAEFINDILATVARYGS